MNRYYYKLLPTYSPYFYFVCEDVKTGTYEIWNHEVEEICFAVTKFSGDSEYLHVKHGKEDDMNEYISSKKAAYNSIDCEIFLFNATSEGWSLDDINWCIESTGVFHKKYVEHVNAIEVEGHELD